MTIREEIEKICKKWSLQDPYRDGYFDDVVNATITEFENMIDEKLNDENAKVSYDYTFALQMLKEELTKK